MADDGEVLETMQRENIPWIDSIHVQSENTTTYSAKGYSRSHQAFTRVQMFPMNQMGKATGNKPKGIKCKLDTGAGVSIMSLSIYQYINPSEFYEQGKPIDGHGQYETILKDYKGNHIQQYGIRVTVTNIFFCNNIFLSYILSIKYSFFGRHIFCKCLHVLQTYVCQYACMHTYI